MNDSNKFEIRAIIWTLCALAMVAVVTICVLSRYGVDIPPELNTLAGGLVGSLGAMLTKTTPTVGTANETKITNTAAEPIPTEPVT